MKTKKVTLQIKEALCNTMAEQQTLLNRLGATVVDCGGPRLQRMRVTSQCMYTRLQVAPL